MSGAQSLWIAAGGVGGLAALVLYVLRPWSHPRHAARPVSLPAYDVPGYLPAPVRVTVDGCSCGVQSGEHKLWCGDELPPPLEAVLRRKLHHVDAYDFGAAEGALRAPGADPAPEDGAGDESEACGPPAPPAPPNAMAIILAAPTVYEIVQKCADAPHHLAVPADVENARVDEFIAEMRADMAAWLTSARERWAAA